MTPQLGHDHDGPRARGQNPKAVALENAAVLTASSQIENGPFSLDELTDTEIEKALDKSSTRLLAAKVLEDPKADALLKAFSEAAIRKDGPDAEVILVNLAPAETLEAEDVMGVPRRNGVAPAPEGPARPVFELQPIETAPYGQEVVLFGESGYRTHETFMVNGFREEDWHRGAWNDVRGEKLSDVGWTPTHWMPKPELKLPVDSPAPGSTAVGLKPVPASWDVERPGLKPARISRGRVADLLVTAFEGGINYWGEIAKYEKPEELTFRTDPEHVYKYVDYPLNAGGAVILQDAEDASERWRLDADAIERGLNLMAANSPDQFQNFLGENEDAETADVFVQYAVLGEIVYG